MKILVRSTLAGSLILSMIWLAGCTSKAKEPRVYHHSPTPVGPPADLSKFEPPSTEFLPANANEVAPEPPPAEAPAASVPVIDTATISDLTPNVTGIIEMAKRGVGGEALLAYVESNPITEKLTSENIIYLNDIGVPENVVATMIRQGESSQGKTPAAPIEKKAIQPPPIASTPPSPTQTSTPPPSTPPLEDNSFHRSLSPYGDWIYDSKHGWVWRPTVARIDSGWRPYCHGGRWIYSDVGWYWNSYYSWGWAPFHYGRWHRSGIHGWYWVPGYRWSPAWVHWRSSNIYAGWAPLPPGCDYVTGVGYMWHGSRVSIGFHFGLSHSHYTYCNYSYMRHRRLHRHRVREKDVTVVHNETKVVNNHITGNNNTIINNGVSPSIVEQKTREPVRKVRIREVDPEVENIAQIGQIDANEKTLAVYRPKMQPPSNANSSETVFKRQQVSKTTVANDNKEENATENKSENESQSKAINGRKIAKKNNSLKSSQPTKGTLKNNSKNSALITRPLGRIGTVNSVRPSTAAPLTPSRSTASSAASPGKPNVVKTPSRNQSRIASSRSKIGPNSISRRPLNSSSTRLGTPSTPSRPNRVSRPSGFKQYSPNTTVKKPIRTYGSPRLSSPTKPSSSSSLSRTNPPNPSSPRYIPGTSTRSAQPSKRPSSLGTSSNYSPNTKSYRAPSRRTSPSYKAPSRSYSPPPRSSSPSRSYSPPSRSSSSSRSYSPPSRSYSPPAAPSRPSAPPSNSNSSKERR